MMHMIRCCRPNGKTRRFVKPWRVVAIRDTLVHGDLSLRAAVGGAISYTASETLRDVDRKICCSNRHQVQYPLSGLGRAVSGYAVGLTCIIKRFRPSPNAKKDVVRLFVTTPKTRDDRTDHFRAIWLGPSGPPSFRRNVLVPFDLATRRARLRRVGDDGGGIYIGARAPHKPPYAVSAADDRRKCQ
jgi:hypothetical protein